MPHSWRTEQSQRNTDGRGSWSRYTDHRERISALLRPAEGTPPGTLLVLGAGNCNDLDLGLLSDFFAAIHLLDLDPLSVEWGIRQQGQYDNGKLRALGGVDVNGLADMEPTAPAEEFLQRLREHVWPVERDYAVTASVGVLSQLIDHVLRCLPPDQPGGLEVLAAVRAQHMKLMAAHTRPGGRVVLVTEFVSSLTVPELLDRAREPAWGELIPQLLAQRNFFTGLNPGVLQQLLLRPPLAQYFDKVELSGPWRWDFGPRTYACVALTAVRTATPVAQGAAGP